MKKGMILILSLLLILSGCASAPTKPDGSFVYFLSQDGRNLLEAEVVLSADEDSTAWIDEMCEMLNTGGYVPSDSRMLLTENSKITSAVNVSGILTVDIGKGYYDLSDSEQVLVRAGITKAFTQNKSINAVVLYVDGKTAVDPSGNELLAMRANTFVDENADGINNYRSSRMTLYFTDETGKKLVTETRNAYYSVNTPIEQAVLNELMAGPAEEGHYRTLPMDLNVLNVTIQDDICYVNFDESFINSVSEIDPLITIYSVVDSIAHICGVNNVIFSVNGSSSVAFRDTVNLEQIFSPDRYFTGNQN